MTTFKTALKTTAASYAKDKNGNFAMMFAVTVATLVGCLACGVDLTNAYASKIRLQDTTDQIALMAAKDKLATDAELQAAAQAYFEINYPNGAGDKIVLDSITRDGDIVTINASNTVDTYFAKMFGKPSLNVGTQSVANFGQRKLNLALVLDTTGSMKQNNKLVSLKVAANDLVETLEGMPTDTVELAVVPFAQYVNVGTDNKNADWLDVVGTRAQANNWTGCVGSRENGWNERVEVGSNKFPGLPAVTCGAEIQPLTSNMSDAKNAINSMKAEGWTYIPSGLAWGWRVLTAGAPFEGAVKSADTDKVMILMTDGKNTRSISGVSHDTANGDQANKLTKTMCEDIKNDDVIIYTIAYELNDAPTKNLLRKCASTNSNFFDASDAGQLKDAFKSITNNLSNLRLTN